jgi:hypothetical protein
MFSFRPSKSAQPLTLLACIRKMPCSILGGVTNYPAWGFSWFSSVPPLIMYGRFLPPPFQFIKHACDAVKYGLETASINELQTKNCSSGSDWLRQRRSSQLRDRGYDNVLLGQGSRSHQRALIEEYGSKGEMVISRANSKKCCSIATSSTLKLIWNHLAINPRFHCERPELN